MIIREFEDLHWIKTLKCEEQLRQVTKTREIVTQSATNPPLLEHLLFCMKVCAGQKYVISFHALKFVHFCAQISHHPCYTSIELCFTFVHSRALSCTLVHFRAGKYTYLPLTKSVEGAQK